MQLVNNLIINDKDIQKNIRRLINQTYKLLPIREEGLDWIKPLSTIIEEFSGMAVLMPSEHCLLFSLLCKLEGLFSLDNKNDFFQYRRIIFDCLSIMGKLIEKCQD